MQLPIWFSKVRGTCRMQRRPLRRTKAIAASAVCNALNSSVEGRPPSTSVPPTSPSTPPSAGFAGGGNHAARAAAPISRGGFASRLTTHSPQKTAASQPQLLDPSQAALGTPEVLDPWDHQRGNGDLARSFTKHNNRKTEGAAVRLRLRRADATSTLRPKRPGTARVSRNEWCHFEVRK